MAVNKVTITFLENDLDAVETPSGMVMDTLHDFKSHGVFNPTLEIEEVITDKDEELIEAFIKNTIGILKSFYPKGFDPEIKVSLSKTILTSLLNFIDQLVESRCIMPDQQEIIKEILIEKHANEFSIDNY